MSVETSISWWSSGSDSALLQPVFNSRSGKQIFIVSILYLLHFCLDAQLHFIALYMFMYNDNKVGSNLI